MTEEINRTQEKDDFEIKAAKKARRLTFGQKIAKAGLGGTLAAVIGVAAGVGASESRQNETEQNAHERMAMEQSIQYTIEGNGEPVGVVIDKTDDQVSLLTVENPTPAEDESNSKPDNESELIVMGQLIKVIEVGGDGTTLYEKALNNMPESSKDDPAAMQAIIDSAKAQGIYDEGDVFAITYRTITNENGEQQVLPVVRELDMGAISNSDPKVLELLDEYRQ